MQANDKVESEEVEATPQVIEEKQEKETEPT